MRMHLTKPRKQLDDSDVSRQPSDAIAKIPSKKSKLGSAAISTVNVNFDNDFSKLRTNDSVKSVSTSISRPKSSGRSRSKDRNSNEIGSENTSLSNVNSSLSRPKSNHRCRSKDRMSDKNVQEKNSSTTSLKPSPPPGPGPSSMFMSQSLKTMVSNRAMRAVSKSRSLGSAGKILPTDSRHRQYSSSFREAIPMLPVNESGNQEDFNEISSSNLSINDIRTKRASSKTSSSTMWVPQQSFVQSKTNLESYSSNTVMVQSAQPPSRQASGSFTSGHIFVTPVASINFVTSTHTDNARNHSAASKTSVNEIVEKQVSGTYLSQQSSRHSSASTSKENVIQDNNNNI